MSPSASDRPGLSHDAGAPGAPPGREGRSATPSALLRRSRRRPRCRRRPGGAPGAPASRRRRRQEVGGWRRCPPPPPPPSPGGTRGPYPGSAPRRSTRGRLVTSTRSPRETWWGPPPAARRGQRAPNGSGAERKRGAGTLGQGADRRGDRRAVNSETFGLQPKLPAPSSWAVATMDRPLGVLFTPESRGPARGPAQTVEPPALLPGSGDGVYSTSTSTSTTSSRRPPRRRGSPAASAAPPSCAPGSGRRPPAA